MNEMWRELNGICRNSNFYPVKRMVVPKNKVSWFHPWPEYAPPNYTSAKLRNVSWADPDIKDEKFKVKWNDFDGYINRQSYDQEEITKYLVVDGYPLNPRGRTGLSGRGSLGRWGPNHAADPIVSRWKYQNGEKELDPKTGLPILQFVAILRKDCDKWAIPGGFIDPKENTFSAALRELFEEAINRKKLTEEVRTIVKDFLSNGTQIYRGYVDDPRNTDNAWIETTAINYHDFNQRLPLNMTLDARDDAKGAIWIDLVEDVDLYPPHYAIIEHLKNIHLPKS